jgi:agmatinase
VTSARPGFLEDKFDAPSTSREHNRFVVSLIPFEETTTYKRGTRNGPDAIVEASGHIELQDEELRIDASEHGILTVRPDITDLDSIRQHATAMAAEHPDALLGFLGGEHSITPALVQGLGVEDPGGQDLGIVWIDAHADLRSEYCGDRFNHACAGFHCAPMARIVQVGIRSLAREETDFLEQTDRVQCFRHWSGEVKEAIRGLPDTVYISFDLDGFNPMLMRAVGTPEPGGLVWEEALEIIDFTLSEKNLRAFDVVELCPNDEDVVSSFTAARLVYKIFTYYAHHRLGG